MSIILLIAKEPMIPHSNIDLNNFGVQIALVCAAIVLLWLLVKSLKMIWKLLFVIGILLALSFALPAVRQWIFSFF